MGLCHICHHSGKMCEENYLNAGILLELSFRSFCLVSFVSIPVGLKGSTRTEQNSVVALRVWKREERVRGRRRGGEAEGGREGGRHKE